MKRKYAAMLTIGIFLGALGFSYGAVFFDTVDDAVAYIQNAKALAEIEDVTYSGNIQVLSDISRINFETEQLERDVCYDFEITFNNQIIFEVNGEQFVVNPRQIREATGWRDPQGWCFTTTQTDNSLLEQDIVERADDILRRINLALEAYKPKTPVDKDVRLNIVSSLLNREYDYVTGEWKTREIDVGR